MAKKMSKKKTKKTQSYDNMMGSPMDAASHPVNSLPPPQGGSFSGMQLPGAPMAPGEGM